MKKPGCQEGFTFSNGRTELEKQRNHERTSLRIKCGFETSRSNSSWDTVWRGESVGRGHWELTVQEGMSSRPGGEAEASGELPFNRKDWIPAAEDVTEEKSNVAGVLV